MQDPRRGTSSGDASAIPTDDFRCNHKIEKGEDKKTLPERVDRLDRIKSKVLRIRFSPSWEIDQIDLSLFKLKLPDGLQSDTR